MTYTIAVIGCGIIGQRLGNAFTAHDQVDLIYAVDLNKEVLDAYCEKFGTTGFTDYYQVLHTDVDIIYVGVPPKWHRQITIDALRAGKHVICEKPIGISADDGLQMAAAAATANRVTAINFPLRYSSSARYMRQHIADLGDINMVELRIRMPRWPRAWQDVAWLLDHDQGGPLREIGSHFIDLIQLLFGQISIKEAQVELTAPDKFEKSVDARFTAGGIPGMIDLETLCDEEEENTLYITGSEGKIRFRNWHILERWEESGWQLIDDRSTNSSLALTAAVVDAIEGRHAVLVSFEQATGVQQVIDDIFSYLN